MPTFKFDDLDIYYNVFPLVHNSITKNITKNNSKKNETEYLFLLHGNSVSSKMFKSEIHIFQKYYNVVVFDYPGLGQSQRVSHFRDDYWNYNSLCLEELIKHLNITDKIDIVGTSGGALTGLNYITRNSDKVRKFIADSFMGYGVNLEESQIIVSRRTRAKSQLMSSAFWKSMNGEDWEQVVDQDIDLMVRCGTKSIKTIQGDFKNVVCEVLCVAAISDELIPHTDIKVKEVADDIPNSSLKIYDFGKHPFMITEKQEFKKLALEFFDLE